MSDEETYVEPDAAPSEDPGTITVPGPETGVSGVKTGDLNYIRNEDGTRNYLEQKPVETTDDATPTPEVDPPSDQPAEASTTSEPVGR